MSSAPNARSQGESKSPKSGADLQQAGAQDQTAQGSRPLSEAAACANAQRQPRIPGAPVPPVGYRAANASADQATYPTPTFADNAHGAPVASPAGATRTSASERRKRRAHRKAAAPLFFGKQAGLFVLLAFCTLVLNFVLYTVVAVAEMNLGFNGRTPSAITRLVGESIAPVEAVNAADSDTGNPADAKGTASEGDSATSANETDDPNVQSDGSPADAAPQDPNATAEDTVAQTGALPPTDTFTISGEAAAALDEAGAWCMLLDASGSVVWQRDLPAGVPLSYSYGDVAALSRNGYVADSPCFVWNAEPGLVVVGLPHGSYYPSSVYLPAGTMMRLPLYVIGLFLLNALIFFCAYVVFKHRVLKSTEPVLDALDDLSCGKPVRVHAPSSMRDIGDSINAASAALLRKDEARKRWVNGVSHDIRTPLAISMGTAERLAADPNASEQTRKAAQVIVRQNERMRDFVSDLNIASRLEYDMQPLDVAPFSAAATARQVAADRINAGLDERFELEVNATSAAEAVKVSADERLVGRAMRNLVENAIRHNESGCRIEISLRCESGDLVVCVADNGLGITPAALARLNAEAAAMKAESAAAPEPDPRLPVPPPLYEVYAAAPHGRTAAPSEMREASNTAGAPSADARGTAPLAPSAEAAAAAASAFADAAETAAAPGEPTLEPKDLAGFNDHGLGLSLVARIAVAHGGSVGFAGAPGKGFAAALRLPLD